MQEPAPPWSRLRPLPVLFVLGLFVALWLRRQPNEKAPPPSPDQAQKESATPQGRRPLPAGVESVRVEEQDGEMVAIFAGAVMGTRWNARILDRIDDEHAVALAEKTQAALDAVDRAMSTYKPESDVSRFNKAAAGTKVEVSAETVTVVAEAMALHEMSDGAFDATVAPLVQAWGFGAGADARPPDQARLTTLRERVGTPHLDLDRKGQTLAKDKDGVRLDLSAVAKGFAVDQAAAALQVQGKARFMIEVGGEVVVRGTAPGGRPWRLGIETPDAAPGTVQEVVPMRDAALATSGDYRNVRMVEGKRMSHTIDPRTGRPVEHALASVSVIAASCMRADGLATTLSVLGPEDGMRFCEAHNVAATFLVRREDGSFDARPCPAWQRALDAVQDAAQEAR